MLTKPAGCFLQIFSLGLGLYGLGTGNGWWVALSVGLFLWGSVDARRRLKAERKAQIIIDRLADQEED